MKRVVITGAGTVNPLGHDLLQTFAAFRAGRTAIGPLDIPDLDRLSINVGAQVRGWTSAAPAPLQAMCDRSTLMALQAADEASVKAGLSLTPDQALTAGVIIGTAGGGHISAENAYRAVFQDRRARVHPFTLPRLMANAAAGQIAIAQGLKGPGLTISTACASSSHAIGLAFQMIAAGQAEVMFAGGTEAMLDFGGIKVWEALRVLSLAACQPFAASRSGMVMGEGAAILVLESLDRAMVRGANILGEIKGFGMTTDAADMMAPGQDGAVRAMKMALAQAGLSPDQIGYVNAHGTGTREGDSAEAAAIAQVFGKAGVPVSATKSAHGHLVGASGALEALACLMALNEGLIAPTVGVEGPDAALAIDLVCGQPRLADVSACLSNSFAFGGVNAALCFARAP